MISRKRKKRALAASAAVALLVLCLTSDAKVFTLRPGGGKGAAVAADALGGAAISSEKVEVNGLETTLTVKLLRADLDECVATLVKAFPKARFAANKASLLMEVKRPDGSIERIFLVRLGGIFPVMQFSMEFPRGLPKSAEWPEEIPRPGGAEPVSAIRLPDKKVACVTFKTSLPPNRVAEDVAADLVDAGWKEFGKGTFVRNDPSEIMIVTARTDDKGVTRGTIFRRPLGK